MAELLYNLFNFIADSAKWIALFVLLVFGVYVLVRVGTFGFLKSKEDFEKRRGNGHG